MCSHMGEYHGEALQVVARKPKSPTPPRSRRRLSTALNLRCTALHITNVRTLINVRHQILIIIIFLVAKFKHCGLHTESPTYFNTIALTSLQHYQVTVKKREWGWKQTNWSPFWPTFITDSTEGGRTTEQQVIKQNKNIPKKIINSQPSVKEPSSCLGYAFEEVVGFPLASSRADVLALWPTEEPCGAAKWESWYFFFFNFSFFKGLDPPFRVRITPFSATPVQKRREEEILGNRRGKRRKQQSSFVCCADCGGWKNQCVILHSWKEK